MLAVVNVAMTGPAVAETPDRPNIILMMADDMGWGDTGFNGNTLIQTPHLDQMAQAGAVLNHFYSIGPVCSPTRCSVLTGRHHFRSGIWTANSGHLPQQEFSIARMLKSQGYATGHFGKWHLGTLSKTVSAKGAKRKPAVHFAPPWERDYDASFVTESAIQLWNPGEGPRAKNNPFYENGQIATENLDGCASRVVMDRAIPFIRNAVDKEKPFVAVIWFHAPHEDIVAGPEYLKMYEGHGEAAHYYGCVTALDEQVGRLREELKSLGVQDNTALFFCSDNGPEGGKPKDRMKTRRAGSAGGFSGRKRSVRDGGIRVPALAVWPGKIEAGTSVETPCCVLDYLSTISSICDAELPADRPLDGENILPILSGEKTIREKAIPIRFQNYACLVKDSFKLIIESPTNALQDQLFDLSRDKTESTNVISSHPAMAQEMRTEILAFLASAKASHAGGDYETSSYQAAEKWRAFGVANSKQRKQSNRKAASSWRVDTQAEWTQSVGSKADIEIAEGQATSKKSDSTFSSVIQRFNKKRSAASITFKQTTAWDNWQEIANVGTPKMQDALVFLPVKPGDYWLMGRHADFRRKRNKRPQNANGLKNSPADSTPMDDKTAGYHAWHSTDMKTWSHRGPVTSKDGEWMTTAEYADGKFYLYYDYPNDQDPHLVVDDDLGDGVPGKSYGMVLDDPTNGSDAGVLRDEDGRFHIIFEDWSYNDARAHSWDAPVAGHGVTSDPTKPFKILDEPAVDERTKPTGKTGHYKHSSSKSPLPYEVHEPEQNAYGDWTAIKVGGQYYLFCDYDPVGEGIRVGCLTSDSLEKQFEFCGSFGKGHPDPTVGFAEGQFYLIQQRGDVDFISPGPWVPGIQARVGVDTAGDGQIDQWTQWQDVLEEYTQKPGFARIVETKPAGIDLTSLPAGFGFQFEYRTKETADQVGDVTMESIELEFK